MDPTRHDSPTDFFDRELLIYALAYSGTFAAIDKWLASLVSHSRRDGFPAFYAYAASLAELEHRLPLDEAEQRDDRRADEDQQDQKDDARGRAGAEVGRTSGRERGGQAG